MKSMAQLAVLLLLLLIPFAATQTAETVTVPNPSFEEGEGDAPPGWMKSAPGCKWLSKDAPDGKRAISVSGTGEDSSAWHSAAIPFKPSSVYRLSFKARSIDASGGTPTTGPGFCNRDLGAIPAQWKTYESIFATPTEFGKGSNRLRFGQWHVKGTIAYDAVSLRPVIPVHLRRGDVVLGEGEAIEGRQYAFQAPFHTRTNHSRPLVSYTSGFNSNRWTLNSGRSVVYRHQITGRQQNDATVTVGVTYRTAGTLTVSASMDGRTWKELGTIEKLSTESLIIPKDLLPAKTVWVRLQVSMDANLQVSSYGFTSTLSGTPLSLQGATRYISIEETDPRLDVTIEDLGDVLPGGANTLVARVKNTTTRAIPARPAITVECTGHKAVVAARDESLAAGEQLIRLPYEVPAAGRCSLRVELGKGIRFKARAAVRIADLYSTVYGERLPGSTDAVGLWWASSGWKISHTRPAPKTEGKALTIRTARNEVEAAQLVVRPEQPLKGLTATTEPLTGPDGTKLPSECVEILNVRYVNVRRPTDRVGVRAPWPDPLPPLTAPLDLVAGKNQPLWVRVKAPRDAKPGIYRGRIQLRAEGWSIAVPLKVEVYNFVLPDRMSCVTAFGFSPSNVWRYQGLTKEADRRAVLEKYWANFAAHHISPYDPAPLDAYKISWPESGGNWKGGTRDTTEKHSGAHSLKVHDNSRTGQVSASCQHKIAIPDGGLRLTFRYKTAAKHAFIVTLNHIDQAGRWMPGRNRDMTTVGNGQWQAFDRKIDQFPEGARAVRLTLWAARWAEDGSTTGTVWFDDVSLQAARSGKELLPGGDFEPVSPEKLVPRFDWSAWDAAMTRAIDHYHFNSYRLKIPGLGGGSFHQRYEPSLLGFGEDTPHYKAAFNNYMGAVERHLKEKGWLDEAFAYWFDEPDPKDYAFVMNGFRKLKETAPGLARMLTEQVEPALIGGPNVWCPVSHHYNHERAEERRKAGDRFWWYVCTGPKEPYCTLFIDHPATEMRVWLWQTWKRKIVGILVWQTNYWTSRTAYPDGLQNPYDDPMGWVSGYGVEKGTKRVWGNGDGRFIYPPERAAAGNPGTPVLEGPVDSIRWEMLRDGIEDYEYLAMLRHLLKTHGAELTAEKRAGYEALLEVPESITRSRTSFTTDPAPIEKRRHEVARAIERLRNADW